MIDKILKHVDYAVIFLQLDYPQTAQKSALSRLRLKNVCNIFSVFGYSNLNSPPPPPPPTNPWILPTIK